MAFSSTPEPRGCAACGHDHLVEFYETEEFLVASVTDFVVGALAGDGAAIVVATPEHREAFEEAIGDEGCDVEAATRVGRYMAIDAAKLLSRFMVDGMPDPVRFTAAVTGLLELVGAGGRPVRVYGEMVALLWGEGHVTATIALEDMWNELAEIRSFSLFCGYPIQSFDVQSRALFAHICGQHGRVIREGGPAAPDAA
ncbi:MAG: hypothetical protein QOI64_1167 [Solirubrobacteraceae bacterium]|jgi:hypothetical protein|nr:hypothetical protein [Solirubrobacteraceae bacterium]